jgi:hypothetical protein
MQNPLRLEFDTFRSDFVPGCYCAALWVVEDWTGFRSILHMNCFEKPPSKKDVELFFKQCGFVDLDLLYRQLRIPVG